MERLVTSAIVALSIAVVGALLLWSHNSLDAWRQALSGPLFNSLGWYFLVVGVTFGVYRFASALVAVSAGRKSRFAAVWIYTRWVLLSGVVAWVFSLGSGGNLARATAALKGFVALAVVGLFGTSAGVKEADSKGKFKQ